MLWVGLVPFWYAYGHKVLFLYGPFLLSDNDIVPMGVIEMYGYC